MSGRSHAKKAVTAVALMVVAMGLSACHSGRGRAATERGGRRAIERGIASWYGPGFQGKATASGEIFNTHDLTAAHKTLPFGTLVEVVNLNNGRKVRVRINDRGPFVRGRIIDLSKAAAERIDLVRTGTAPVKLYRVGSQLPPEVRPGPWTVQVAAFQELDRAIELAAELTPRFPATVVRSDEAWHRVQIGDYDDRAQAEATARQLEAEGHQALVVRADGRQQSPPE